MSKSIKSLKAMGKSDQSSMLIVYHTNTHYPDYYFIPDAESLPINLRRAILKLHGFVCNESDWTDSLDKAWAYFGAASTENPDYLDQENRFNANRFAHKLLPYKVNFSEKAPSFNVRNLTLVSIGFFLRARV